MTGTERKRLWRLRNPERSREAAERTRAEKRRRHRSVIEWTLGKPPVCFEYPSGESYQRYEASVKRMMVNTRSRARCRAAALDTQIAALDVALEESTRRLNEYLATPEGQAEAREWLAANERRRLRAEQRAAAAH
jgi:hypothetical protein